MVLKIYFINLNLSIIHRKQFNICIDSGGKQTVLTDFFQNASEGSKNIPRDCCERKQATSVNKQKKSPSKGEFCSPGKP